MAQNDDTQSNEQRKTHFKELYLLFEAGIQVGDADEVECDGRDVGGIVGARQNLCGVAKGDLVVVLDGRVLAICRFERAVAD